MRMGDGEGVRARERERERETERKTFSFSFPFRSLFPPFSFLFPALFFSRVSLKICPRPTTTKTSLDFPHLLLCAKEIKARSSGI